MTFNKNWILDWQANALTMKTGRQSISNDHKGAFSKGDGSGTKGPGVVEKKVAERCQRVKTGP